MHTGIDWALVCKAAIAVLIAGGSTTLPALGATPLTHTRACGGTEYGIRAQREKVSLPGLTAPRIYFDGRDADSDLDDTYAHLAGRNDVVVSPFEPFGRYVLRPVAEQLGVYCNGDAPAVVVRLLHWGDVEPGSRRRSQVFTDYESDDILAGDNVYSQATGDGEWLAGGEFATLVASRNPRGRDKHRLVLEEVFEFEVVVDPALDVRLPEVEGFHAGDPPRPTGRADFGDGNTSEYVLDELMMLVPDDAALQGLLERWGAELVDRSPLDRDGMSTALVRFDPAVLAMVDTTGLAAELLVIEPDHRGVLAMSSERLVQLFAVAATEFLQHGTIVSPNTLLHADSITSGSTTEGPFPNEDGAPLDAFAVAMMSDTGGIRSGVGRAWQVMDATVGFDHRVTVMVVDGGFTFTFDLPDNTIVRKTEWGTQSSLPAWGGGAAPWHGTYSATTAAGIVDNAYGTAGPGGPVSDLVLVGVAPDDYTTLRRVRDMVVEYRPEIVNMSIGAKHWAFRKLVEAIKDVYFKQIHDLDALIFASSGNDGQNNDMTVSGDETPTILPCESKYVVCVGGVNNDGTHPIAASNYGTKEGDKTVEIHGPICTFGNVDYTDLGNLGVDRTCGTSVSSPFVAGVAALVRSANPNLSNTAVRDILYDTAHTGPPLILPLPGGYDRRVNALDAVVAALGIELTPPSLTILDPDPGAQIGKDDLLDVRAVAHDTFGRPLSIRWKSDKVPGVLATTASGIFTAIPLAPGVHAITARATDFRGAFTEKTVQVTVGLVPEVTIIMPQPGAQTYVGTGVTFIASSSDPDTGDPLPDNSLVWKVRKNGIDIWDGVGHDVNASANVFSPGNYDVHLSATDGDGTGTDTTSFTVLALPPGEDPPTALILTPAADIAFGAYNGHPQPVNLEGAGVDNQDISISGFRMRWTAFSNMGTAKVLCEGSNVPGSGNGGIVIPLDCSTFTAQLGTDQGATVTTWVVLLEVFDSAGLRGKATRIVKVTAFTG